MNTRERRALTFLLETYLKIPTDFYLSHKYDLSDKGIGNCIKFLINESVVTVTGLSQELKKHYGIKIAPLQLKRYSEQNFDEFIVWG